MKTTLITETEIADLKISSLPSRPSAPVAFGGAGYTSAQIKEAFDKLPLFIIERLNTLISDITAVGEDSFAAAIPTGIKEEHFLCDLFADISSGEFIKYLSCGKDTLYDVTVRFNNTISNLITRVKSLEDKVTALEAAPTE